MLSFPYWVTFPLFSFIHFFLAVYCLAVACKCCWLSISRKEEEEEEKGRGKRKRWEEGIWVSKERGKLTRTQTLIAFYLFFRSSFSSPFIPATYSTGAVWVDSLHTYDIVRRKEKQEEEEEGEAVFYSDLGEKERDRLLWQKKHLLNLRWPCYKYFFFSKITGREQRSIWIFCQNESIILRLCKHDINEKFAKFPSLRCFETFFKRQNRTLNLLAINRTQTIYKE